MKNKGNMFKWITVAILGFCVVLFFLPYIKIAGEFKNPIQLLEIINDNRGAIRSDATFEVVFSFIVPVALTLLSALFMLLKTSIPKSVISSVLNLIAASIYLLFFNQTFFDTSSGNVGFGLTGNVIIACVGIVLPIVTVVAHKKTSKSNSAELV
ncbi:MAG: hypothetical protein LBC73_06895 [Oscillospiraceae bacterium]|nr:hypothetical protein [Oscillospiraceae bacterium]